jgi:hypothetical protein
MARPFEKLPPGSRDALLAMAGNGLKESTAAKALGVPLNEFRRVISKNPEAKALWQEALSVERDALINALFNRAIEGDTKAAQFLLSARHGMSEKHTESLGDRVNITFQLPAALSPDQYTKLVHGTSATQSLTEKE